MSFKEYAEHGWKLCRIHEGEKRPRGDGWNRRENAIENPVLAEHLFNAGLLHAYSGTCAIDIDNFDLAKAWLRDRGIDLDAMVRAPDAVQIVSGDASRGKLLYALPEALPTKQIKNDDKSIMILELRCGATTGNSAQDVLPPSTNPRTGKQYQWKTNGPDGSWQRLPQLPDTLHALWLSLIAPKVERSAIELLPTAHVTELRTLLKTKSPDLNYDDWIRVGMALHHETQGSDDGLAIWDEWSQRGTKYPGFEQLEYKWNSFGHAPNPVTAGFLRQGQVAKIEDFAMTAQQSNDILDDIAKSDKAAALSEFTWLKPRDIVSRPPPPWLIRNILPQYGLNALYGPSGAGKSFVALDMALAIARGVPWRDYPTKPGPVAWIAAEAFDSMRNRLRAYNKHHGVTVDDIDDFNVLGTSINILDKERMKVLAETAATFKPLLIFVDTLAAATAGMEENDTKDMGIVMDNSRMVSAISGAVVVFVHHTGKDLTRGMRGSNSLQGRVEAEILVCKRECDPVVRDITPTKLRDSNKERVVHPFKLAGYGIDMHADGELITSAAVEHMPIAAAPVKPKVEPEEKRGVQAMAIDTLESLWPVDGEPVISIDSFLGKYAEGLVAPDGADNRITMAKTMLNSLAKKMLVSVDNARGTVTLLSRLKAEPKPATPIGVDRDADLL